MSADPEVPTPSAAFIEAFRDKARQDFVGTHWMPFDLFMALALYHPELGYYHRDRARVGRSSETDFYTATSSGVLFGELICAACVKLLGPDREPKSHTFVEIGAEPDGGILKGVKHPFKEIRVIRVSDPLNLAEIAGPLIVFSNELFDAQPFRRFVTRAGQWRELGVSLSADGRLSEIELNSGQTASAPPVLPTGAMPPATTRPDGYHVDLPLASAQFASAIASPPWSGLFIACDYGKSWRELTEATPQGTARAYHRHQQSNDLLARPGEQDLTCHVCWDWLADALAHHGFSSPTVESQESFLIHHAGDFIAQLTAAEAARLSPRKLSLMQLLHPANMGQKFQVLHALRV